MKIGIILHPYGEDKPAGLAKAILELTSELIRIDTENEYLIFVKGNPKFKPKFSGGHWQFWPLGDEFFWLEGLSKAPEADVYIFNTPILPIFYKPKKSIVIALDFAYKYFRPENWRDYARKIITSWYNNFSLRKADAVVAISQATRNDIIKFFKIRDNKIKVVYLGFDKKSDWPEEAIETPEKFFLFVGVIKERKNVLNIVTAFREFEKKYADYKLVIVGKGEGKYYQNIKNYVREEGIEEKVKFFGYLNDWQLVYLYRRALALVFPSLVEGFGFPVLEAMDFGLPVITSNISSLAEIADNNSAILVDPFDIGQIQAAMEKIVSDDDFRRQLIENGFRQSQKFSWTKTAGQILEIIKHLANRDKKLEKK